MLFILPFLNYFTLFSSKFWFRSPLVLSVQFFFFCFERDPQIVLIFLVSFIIVMYFSSLPLFFSLSVLQVVLLRQERWSDMLKNLYTDIPQIQKKKKIAVIYLLIQVSKLSFLSPQYLSEIEYCWHHFFDLMSAAVSSLFIYLFIFCLIQVPFQQQKKINFQLL